jgi:predicted MFS family arabinose efflux permease
LVRPRHRRSARPRFPCDHPDALDEFARSIAPNNPPAANDLMPTPDPVKRFDSLSVVIALGITQTVAWASSTYLPAILATPIARDLGISRSTVFGAFSVSLLVMAAAGPRVGRAIDRAGGRGVLLLSHVLFAAGLTLLGMTEHVVVLFGAWCVLGLAMALGLYDAAFATLVRIYGHGARKPITGITLIAGFASTVGWPLSTYLDAQIGWRGACFVWAALHVVVALPLTWRLIPLPGAAVNPNPAAAPRGNSPSTGSDRSQRPARDYAMLGVYFATTAFVTSAFASHLPGLLAVMGAGSAGAVFAAALLGPAQVAARFIEFGVVSRFGIHALASARVATALHPVACVVVGVLGGPPMLAALFAILHGAGNGLITIAKGALPLALFGPAGYGLTQGWLSVGARGMQALAPYAFGLTLDGWGGQAALVLSGTLSLVALATLFVLRPRAS